MIDDKGYWYLRARTAEIRRLTSLGTMRPEDMKDLGEHIAKALEELAAQSDPRNR